MSPRADWTTERVLGAVAEWIWVPDGARTHTAEGLVVAEYPEYFEMPTQAFVLDSDRDADGLIAQAEGVARSWNRPTLWWAVTDTTRPQGLEPELMRRGAEVTERTDILAIPLDADLPALDPPGSVEIRSATDLFTMRDALLVQVEAFESEHEVTDERAATALAEVDPTAAEPVSGRLVAYANGIAVASAGWTVVGDVLRLWGAGTTPMCRSIERRSPGAVRARSLGHRVGHRLPGRPLTYTIPAQAIRTPGAGTAGRCRPRVREPGGFLRASSPPAAGPPQPSTSGCPRGW
ncbi:MAG: hypothetical protein V9G19_25525 [Tetrasphaera sp.]